MIIKDGGLDSTDTEVETVATSNDVDTRATNRNVNSRSLERNQDTVSKMSKPIDSLRSGP